MLNYRRGFLRIYVILAAGWAVLWLYLATSELIQQRRIEAPTRLSGQIDESRRNGYSDDEIVAYLEENRPYLAQQIQQGKRSGHSPTDILTDILKSLPGTLEVDPGAIQRNANGGTVDYDALAKKYGGVVTKPAGGKWFIKQRDYGEAVFSLEMALIPPAIGYVLFFVVVPWIGRGFRASK